MNDQAQLNATLRISGTLECRDKDGNLLKTIEMNGEIPLFQPEPEEDTNGDQRSE